MATTARTLSERYVFALGATERLRALTKNPDVVVLSNTDGTFAIMDEPADVLLEDDLTKDELMDRLDDAATLDLNGIFGEGSLNRTNADLHPTIQRLAR